MHAAGITCSQRLGDLVACCRRPSRPRLCALLAGAPAGQARAGQVGGRSSTPPASRRASRRCCRSGSGRGSCRSARCSPGCCWPRPLRPAHLTRVLAALRALPEGDQRRLGVDADWPAGPHPLTYRQLEYTFRRVARALAKDEPDGIPSAALQASCDGLLEASVPDASAPASSLAVDWTDLESFSRPPPARDRDCADPEASWGHRKTTAPATRTNCSTATTSSRHHGRDDHGPAVPELVRRITLTVLPTSTRSALVPVLTPCQQRHQTRRRARRLRLRLPHAGAWALPVRAPAPNSSWTCTPTTAARRAPTRARSSPTATCTARPRRGPARPRAARPAAPPPSDRRARHQTAELARYKLGRITTDDADGYHRVACPAAMGKLRCPLRPDVDDPGHTAPRSSPPPSTRRPAAPSRRSPSRRGRGQDRPKTRLPIGRAPPLLRPPHGAERASPPPKTPPPTTSPTAGAASWA